jgi:SAM-dependent methyltransferase
MKLLRALIAASLAFVMVVEPITASGFVGALPLSAGVQGRPQMLFDSQALSLPPDFAEQHPTSEHALQERIVVGHEIKSDELLESSSSDPYGGTLEDFTRLTPQKFVANFSAWLIRYQKKALSDQQISEIERFAELLRTETGLDPSDSRANFSDILRDTKQNPIVRDVTPCLWSSPFVSAQLLHRKIQRRLEVRDQYNDFSSPTHSYVLAKVAGVEVVVDLTAGQFFDRDFGVLGITVLPMPLVEARSSALPWYTTWKKTIYFMVFHDHPVVEEALRPDANDLPPGLSVAPIQMTRPVNGQPRELRGEVWRVDLNKIEATQRWAENYRIRDLEQEFHIDNDPNVGLTVEQYIQAEERPGDIVLAVNSVQEHFVQNNALLIHEGQWVMSPPGRIDLIQAVLRRNAKAAGNPIPEFGPQHGIFPILSLDPEFPGIFEVEVGLDGIPIGEPPVREGFTGPVLLRDGISQIDRIHFSQRPKYGGNDVDWSEDKRQAISAFGYDDANHLIIVQIYGAGEDPAAADPNLEEGIRILQKQGVRDAVLGGTSADVQRWSSHLAEPFFWTHARAGSLLEKSFGTPRGRRVGTALLFRKRNSLNIPGAAGFWTSFGLRDTRWIGLIEGILTGLYGWHVLADAMPPNGFSPVWSAIAMAGLLPFAKAIGVIFFAHYLTGVIIPGKDKPVRLDFGRSLKATGIALSGFVGLPLIGFGLGMSGGGAYAFIGIGVLTGGVVHGALNFSPAPTTVDQTAGVYEEIAERYADLTAASPHSNFLQEHLPAFLLGLPQGRILDVGSGAGAFVQWFHERGRQAFGMDLSENLLRLASERQTSVSHTAWLRGDMRKWFFAPSSFAGIWSTGSLHHVLNINEVRQVLRYFYRTLVPHGRLFVSVKEGKGVRTERDGRSYRYFQIDELCGLLKAAGFRILKSGSEGGDRSRWVYAFAEADKTFAAEWTAEYDFIRADGRTRGSGRIEKVTLYSWAGLSIEAQERLLKQAIARHETEDRIRAVALMEPLEQGEPLQIAFVPREFKADPSHPIRTLIDMFRLQRLTKSAQLTSFFTSWDSPEDIQQHVWTVPGRPGQEVHASINLRRALRPGGGQPAQDCTLCNSVIRTKWPTEFWMRLGDFLIYFNPFPIDAPKPHSAIYDQPLRSVMVWAGRNAPEGHISQGDIYQVRYLREARTQWIRLNAGFLLAWFKKFRIEINGWGYGKDGNHGGATQDHIHMHLSRKLYSSESVPVEWRPDGWPDYPGVSIGLMNALPGQSEDGSRDVMLLALEAEGNHLPALDEAVSEALKNIAEEKDSFDVLYFETHPRTAKGWVGFVLRKLGLGPWLPEAFGPRVRVLLTGRIKAQAENGTPLGAYQITGLENVIEGNPSRYYRLTDAQKAEYASIPKLEDQIALINGWLKEGAIVRLSDQELFENFRSELQQTAYSRAQVEALLAKLTRGADSDGRTLHVALLSRSS